MARLSATNPTTLIPRRARIHGEPAATYESAATRKFQRGRTETIRSCSAESLAFCRAMLEPHAAPTAKIEALKNAINAHKEYARDVSTRWADCGAGRGSVWRLSVLTCVEAGAKWE